eukprot:g7544.t1
MHGNSYQEFFEDDTLHVLISKLLNCQNEEVSDKDTKLDVLAILANLSGSGHARAKEEVRTALQGVSEWFDDYLGGEQGDGLEQLKTEDLLELTRGDRGLALDSVVGVLEDGRTYATELVQSRKPGEGNVAQWEHELICRQYEKPLVLQLCRLVRGFTHPASYFAGHGDPSSDKNDRSNRGGDAIDKEEDLALYSDSLLEITLRSRVIEKLSVALDACLFQHQQDQCPATTAVDEANYWDGGRRLSSIAMADSGGGSGTYEERRVPLEDSDHLAVHCVHIFMQNLYHYATQNTDFYRQHMLSDTLLVPRLVLPYLDQCVRQARLLCHRGPSVGSQHSNGWIDDESSSVGRQEGDKGSEEHVTEVEAALAQGIASSLRTLVIASFRAPPNKFVLGLMQRLNPTGSLLRARSFVARHDYIFALLCLLNVNMGALNTSAFLLGTGESATAVVREEEGREKSVIGETPIDLSLEMVLAQGLLDDMAGVYKRMSPEARRRVVRRVTQSGALPVSRDAPGYSAVLRLLGVADSGNNGDERGPTLDGEATRAESKTCPDGEDWASDRKSAKSEAEARVRKLSRESAITARAAARRDEGEPEGTGDSSSAVDVDHKQHPAEGERKKRALVAEAKGAEEAGSGDLGDGDEKGAGRGLAYLGDLPSLGKKMDPAALKDLKLQRVRVDLDLPSNAMSARLRAACGTSHADGSKTARSGNDSQSLGSNGNGRRGKDAPGGGAGDKASGGVGVSKRVAGLKTGGRDRTNGNDGVPKVGPSI